MCARITRSISFRARKPLALAIGIAFSNMQHRECAAAGKQQATAASVSIRGTCWRSGMPRAPQDKHGRADGATVEACQRARSLLRGAALPPLACCPSPSVVFAPPPPVAALSSIAALCPLDAATPPRSASSLTSALPSPLASPLVSRERPAVGSEASGTSQRNGKTGAKKGWQSASCGVKRSRASYL